MKIGILTGDVTACSTVPILLVLKQVTIKRIEKNQQDATVRCLLLLTSISTSFGHHYAHLQESKEPVSAVGVLVWFCWMWLVAVVGRCLVGCEHYEGFIAYVT